MARRYSGQYSPGPQAEGQTGGPADGSPASAPTRAPATPVAARPGLRSWLLFLLPLALIPRAFAQGAGGLVLTLLALALMLLAAWLTREGERAQIEYDSRRVARRPAFPRKMAGSLVMGLGFMAAALPASGLLAALGLGVAGAALHFAAFGPDPMRDKGMEGIDLHSQNRASRAVGQAEAYLKAMSDAILRANDRHLQARVEAFQATARTMFRRVEEDPRDLSAARKYLTVYLMGARDATVKFVDLYASTRDARARADYEALLADLETGFARQNEALLTDNREDLDVEVEVLRERLAREGIATDIAALSGPPPELPPEPAPEKAQGTAPESNATP